MSFLRHREPHQADEQLKSSELLDERARPFGHALAHPADESLVGYSWRVALQHCPLPLHQPRLIVSKRSVENNNFFDPVRLWLNFLSHSWGAVHLRPVHTRIRLKLKLHRLKPDGISQPRLFVRPYLKLHRQKSDGIFYEFDWRCHSENICPY